MVVCPNCQHHSADPLFCDRCNSVLPSPAAAVLPDRLTLRDGTVLDCSAWHGAWPGDCWRPLVVVAAADRPYHLYGLNRPWWRELAARVQERAALTLDVLPPVEILPVEDGAIVVAAGLPDAVHPLLTATADDDGWSRLEETLAACRLLCDTLGQLHAAGLVWLAFDPQALEMNARGARLTNLDLQLFRTGSCPDSLRLSSAYSPPEVCAFRADRIGPATDVFHASLYLYYRLAGLLPGGFPGQGLEAFDFDIPPLRIYCPHLPAGIAPVLARGLCRDPAQRFATMRELWEAMARAMASARQRHFSAQAVSWDCAGATVVGRSHEVQDLPNQDSHTLLSLGRDRLLAIIADGVTHARVGSGEVASQTAVEVLAGTLPLAMQAIQTEEQLDAALNAACLEASSAILELALGAAPPSECDPADMMSSTVVVGVLAGNTLTLANAGDSRAYLIADGRCEQLTVDGDVRCNHLAAGWAPEEVRDMGTDASSLYTCLGVGEIGRGGHLEVSLRRSLPHLGRWKLLPGDIVVLCSDGLVEEGIFLEPGELPALILDPPGQSATEIANRLVSTARSRHRDPSPWESSGCGDDVTCIVLVIKARQGPGEFA
jgi:serine/threonine protein phosphatase PrpC